MESVGSRPGTDRDARARQGQTIYFQRDGQAMAVKDNRKGNTHRH